MVSLEPTSTSEVPVLDNPLWPNVRPSMILKCLTDLMKGTGDMPRRSGSTSYKRALRMGRESPEIVKHHSCG